MSVVGAVANQRSRVSAPVVAAVLLGCFAGAKQAARKRRFLESRLRGEGNHVLETTIVGVDRAGKVSVHDPRRVLVGAATAALTWGLFGLVSGGWPSLLVSAVLGAAWGAWVARSLVHHLSAAQLAKAGGHLPRDSSALLLFTDGAKAESMLSAAEAAEATVASVASIADDLSATVLPVEGDGGSTDEHADQLSMVLVRYHDVAAAKEVVGRIAADNQKKQSLDVELLIEIDSTGRRRVSDPKLGAGAVARYNVRSWTLLGLVCGALAGLTGGRGVAGIFESGLVTGIAWGLFGAAAGALYGLWVGRTISARRLRPLAPLLPENTSSLVGWTDAPHDEVT